MIQGKLLSYGDDLSEAFAIRRKVFVEEMGIPEDKEFEEFEQEAIHVLVYEEDMPEKQNGGVSSPKTIVATGRITYDGENCEIGHIAVLKEYRNKLYGDFTVRMLINRAFLSGIPTVSVKVTKDLVGFFERIGFKIVQENEDKDSLIKMDIRMDDVVTCCKK